jgi:lysozyme
MTASDRAQLVADLERDEGVKPFPYWDCCGKPLRECACTPKWKGKLTIGIGRNLEDRGLSPDEMRYLVQNDIDVSVEDLNRGIPWWDRLSPARQRVLVNMCFNLGWTRLRGFVRTLAAIRRGDYAAAAQGMRESLWARQVGARAERLARIMETGE